MSPRQKLRPCHSLLSPWEGSRRRLCIPAPSCPDLEAFPPGPCPPAPQASASYAGPTPQHAPLHAPSTCQSCSPLLIVGSHLAGLRAYFWLCTLGSTSGRIWGSMGCWGSTACKASARPTAPSLWPPTPFLSSPRRVCASPLAGSDPPDPRPQCSPKNANCVLPKTLGAGGCSWYCHRPVGMWPPLCPLALGNTQLFLRG